MARSRAMTNFLDAYDVTPSDLRLGFEANPVAAEAWETLNALVIEYRTSMRRDIIKVQLGYLNAKLEHHATMARVMTDLEAIRGMNSRTAAEVLQRGLDSISDSETRLATQGSLYNSNVMQQVRVAYNQAPAKGENANAAAWATVASALFESGVVSETDAALPQIYQEMVNQYGDPEAEGSGVTGSTLQEAVRLKNNAISATNRHRVARARVAGVNQQLKAAVGEMSQRDPNAIISAADAKQLQMQMVETQREVRNLIGMDPLEAQAKYEEVFAEDQLQASRLARLNDLEKVLFAQGKDDWRTTRGKVVASEAFQLWAKDNGFNIGSAEVRTVKDVDGNVVDVQLTNYIDGPEDQSAIDRFYYQLQNPTRYGPMPFHKGRTGEYVTLYMKPEPELIEMLTRQSRLPDGRLAYTYDENGAVEFLTQEAVDLIKAAREPRMFMGSYQEGEDGPVTKVIVDRSRDEDVLYRYEDDEWVQIKQEDVPPGITFSPATVGHKVTIGEGEEATTEWVDDRYLIPSDLHTSPDEGLRVAAESIGYDDGTLNVDENIPDITFTTDASAIRFDDTYGIVRRGQRAASHAGVMREHGVDAYGLYTGEGLVVIENARDKIVREVVHTSPSSTSFVDVINKRIGENSQIKAEILAKRLEDPDWDRGVSEYGPGERLAPGDIKQTTAPGGWLRIVTGESGLNIWDRRQATGMERRHRKRLLPFLFDEREAADARAEELIPQEVTQAEAQKQQAAARTQQQSEEAHGVGGATVTTATPPTDEQVAEQQRIAAEMQARADAEDPAATALVEHGGEGPVPKTPPKATQEPTSTATAATEDVDEGATEKAAERARKRETLARERDLARELRAGKARRVLSPRVSDAMEKAAEEYGSIADLLTTYKDEKKALEEAPAPGLLATEEMGTPSAEVLQQLKESEERKKLRLGQLETQLKLAKQKYPEVRKSMLKLQAALETPGIKGIKARRELAKEMKPEKEKTERSLPKLKETKAAVTIGDLLKELRERKKKKMKSPTAGQEDGGEITPTANSDDDGVARNQPIGTETSETEEL